jgi:hypothetical protein
VDVDCPLDLQIPATGTTQLTCTLTSLDGFDGYINLQGFTGSAGGNVSFDPIDVRVPLDETAKVTLPLHSTNAPLGPLEVVIDVSPEEWSSGPASFGVVVVP